MLIQDIKFVDLQAQYADVENELVEGIRGIIHSGAFVGGKPLEEFEAALATYVGTKYAIGCCDGTAALKLALLAAGMHPGDLAIVPTNSFIATANAVVHAGGVPVMADCDPYTYLIDLGQVEEALKKQRIRFVLPVHLYGNPCPMVELLALCDKYGAQVIEDNAQAMGARVNGQRTGSFGLAAGTSFYPAKNLGAFGQGGAVMTNDAELARKVRCYVEQGQGGKRYHHDVVGYNDRLHTIQAFVLGKLLPRLDNLNARRLVVANHYAARLPFARVQRRTTDSIPVYHLFEFRCDSLEQRDALALALKQQGIGFGYHYPLPIHKQKAYPDCNGLSLPVAEHLADTLISLPIHPFLTEEEVDRVTVAVKAVVGGAEGFCQK